MPVPVGSCSHGQRRCGKQASSSSKRGSGLPSSAPLRLLVVLLLQLCLRPCTCERSVGSLEEDPVDILLPGPVVRRGRKKKRSKGRASGKSQNTLVGDRGATQICHRISTILKPEDALESCPENCAYRAEERRSIDNGECRFKCVKAEECGKGSTDPNATIADEELNYCRRCHVPGCLECDVLKKDKCLPDQCAYGYEFDEKTGMCVSDAATMILGLKVVLSVVMCFLAVWYFDIFLLRPAVNEAGAEEGMRFRDATKLKMPREGTEGRPDYPLTTIFQQVSSAGVAGAGTVLHFNFQLAVIIWSFLAALGWYLLAVNTDKDLLELGYSELATTPAQFCGAIHFGYHLQWRMMWVKVAYLACLYALTFAGSIIFAAVQLRRFCMMDDETTMKDFMALVTGLPTRQGSEASVEEDTKEFLEQCTGLSLVGVSVCWNFHERSEEVAHALEVEMRELEEASSADGSGSGRQADVGGDGDGGSGGTPSNGRTRSSRSASNCVRRILMSVDWLLLKVVGGAETVQHEELQAERRERHAELLHGLKTSSLAFAVFKSEEARDAAVEASSHADGFVMPGYDASTRVRLLYTDTEPETVQYEHIGKGTRLFVQKLTMGILTICTAQVLWAVLFYYPYASYIAAFTYAYGDVPDSASRFIFGLLVIAGNQTMYFICAKLACVAGFWFKDHQEAFYTVLYSVTCFLNIVVDMGITSLLAYRQMVALGIRTVDGRRLADLTSVHDIFEAFSMQKSLGEQIWLYNFPSTFLIPFLAEPICAVFMIRHLMTLVVRTHADLTTRQAEQALSIFVPMDMGRYADILLNVLLASACLFCAPGYYVRTFISLGLSLLWVILYDHYRVLRCVPAFCYSSDTVDRIAQAMLGVPCGLILVALIVKSNCMTGSREPGPVCVRDADLGFRMLAGFVLHMAFFITIHQWVLPMCLRGLKHEKAVGDYALVASTNPCSWFSSNPVHCLRSKIIHKHSPPCTYYVQGKEHLLKANPAIACHFEVSASREAG